MYRSAHQSGSPTVAYIHGYCHAYECIVKEDEMVCDVHTSRRRFRLLQICLRDVKQMNINMAMSGNPIKRDYIWQKRPIKETIFGKRDLYFLLQICLRDVKQMNINTGWRRLIGSHKLPIIFHKRATKYRSLLRKMTCKIRHPMSLRHSVWQCVETL